MSEKYRERLTRLKSHFGSGPLSEAEYNYLISIQDLIRAAKEHKFGFSDVLEIIMQDLRELSRHNNKIDGILSEGVVLEVLDELDALERAGTNGSEDRGAAPLSVEESKFLNDISRMIDFALKNGVGFHFPIDIMAHDITEVLFSHGGSIEKALERCFSPKSTGWAEIDENSFGEAEEA